MIVEGLRVPVCAVHFVRRDTPTGKRDEFLPSPRTRPLEGVVDTYVPDRSSGRTVSSLSRGSEVLTPATPTVSSPGR